MSNGKLTFAEDDVTAFLAWAESFATRLGSPELAEEFRAHVLRLVCKGFPAVKPKFDVGNVLAGKADAEANLMTALQALHYFLDQNDATAAQDAALLAWGFMDFQQKATKN